MGIAKESRTSQRIPFASQVSVNLHDLGTLSAVAINISNGGLLLRGQGPLPLYSFCAVAVSLPRGSGVGSLLTEGRIVRCEGGVTAIQFREPLGVRILDAVLDSNWIVRNQENGSLYWKYLAYFRIGTGSENRDYLRVFGVDRATFGRVSALTLVGCTIAALVPIWLLRAHIPAAPTWMSLIAAFTYGVLWLMILHPAIDLAIFRILRSRRR